MTAGIFGAILLQVAEDDEADDRRIFKGTFATSRKSGFRSKRGNLLDLALQSAIGWRLSNFKNLTIKTTGHIGVAELSRERAAGLAGRR
jgi:hypothetical protein